DPMLIGQNFDSESLRNYSLPSCGRERVIPSPSGGGQGGGPLALHQCQPVAGRYGPIRQGFVGGDLLLQGGLASPQRGIVEGEVLGILRALELEVVDEAP